MSDQVDLLEALWKGYRWDFDLMRCRGCNRAIHISFIGDDQMNHAVGCKNAASQNPWRMMQEALSIELCDALAASQERERVLREALEDSLKTMQKLRNPIQTLDRAGVCELLNKSMAVIRAAFPKKPYNPESESKP